MGKLTDAEKTLAILLLARRYDQSETNPISITMDDLLPWFDRPSRLQKAVASMAILQIVKRSVGANHLSIDVNKLLTTLQFRKVAVPDLFTLTNSSAPAQLSMPKSGAPAQRGMDPKARPKPSKINHAAHVHAPHASCLMPHASQEIHVSHESHDHDSCNKTSKKIHDHDHEVGELERRTTEEMLADLRKLQPNISAEFLEQWRKRIELENAEAVNAVIRQAQLNRGNGQIKNMGGWMNKCYLVAIGVKQKNQKL